MSPTTLFPLCSLLSLSLSLTRFFRLALSPTQSPVTLYVLAASLYPYQKAFFLSRGYIQSTLRLERTQVSLVPSTSVLSPVLWAATARRASTFFFPSPAASTCTFKDCLHFHFYLLVSLFSPSIPSPVSLLHTLPRIFSTIRSPVISEFVFADVEG